MKKLKKAQDSVHIDGTKDNSTAGAAEQANDAILISGGNLGIGTTNPTQKLDVIGKIKITDGSQADGRVLTSDANGVGIWKDLAPAPSIEATWLIGNFQAATNNSIPSGSYSSIAKLSLPAAGTYLVFFNADFGFVGSPQPSAGYVESLVTKGQVTNAVNLSGAVEAVTGTWNTLYNALQTSLGSFTINNIFFITTTGPQNLYLTVKPSIVNGSNTGIVMQRYGDRPVIPLYGKIPGGLITDIFTAYKL